jgi:flagellar motor switch protein FliM
MYIAVVDQLDRIVEKEELVKLVSLHVKFSEVESLLSVAAPSSSSIKVRIYIYTYMYIHIYIYMCVKCI